jgi:ribosomal protein S18 acetylase RimI-like enzyme
LSLPICEYLLVKAFVRPSTVADRAFHQAMTFEAYFSARKAEKPPFGQATHDPKVRQYFERWGRSGDTAVVAADPLTGQRLGMAWSRLYAAKNPTAGFIDPEVPEVSIALIEDARGRKLGTQLMESLLEANRQAGFKKVSLAVEENNPAKRLYERLGFTQVRAEGPLQVMKLTLGLSARSLT